MKAIEIAETNGCEVYGTYNLTKNFLVTEFIVSGDLTGSGNFFHVNTFCGTFREATELEYSAAVYGDQ